MLWNCTSTGDPVPAFSYGSMVLDVQSTHPATQTLPLHWLKAAIAVLPTSSLRLDASRTPDTPEPDRATRPAAAAAAAAALSGLMAPGGRTRQALPRSVYIHAERRSNISIGSI